jgi:hypothetical protein
MDVENQLLKQDTEYLKKEVAELKKQTSDGFMAINLKLDIMAEKYVRREEVDREFERVEEKMARGLEEHEKDLTKIEENIKWVVRSIIALFITALGAIIFINK